MTTSKHTPPLTRSQRLLRDARETAELRRYRTHPDVAALGIERIRTAVGVLVWTGLVLGLLFTMSNVQAFAARGAAPWSLPWVIAWFLDPMVSLCLVGVLIAESTLARYQLMAGPWVRGAKWGLLGATFLMNTWASLWNWPPTPAPFLLHAVPPLVVWVMAEAITDLRSRLTDAVVAAHRYATHALAATSTDSEAATWPTIGTDPAGTRTVAAAERIALAATPREAAVAGDPPDRETTTTVGEPDHAARVADRTASTDRSSGPDRGTEQGPGPVGQGPVPPEEGPDLADLLEPGQAVRDRLAAQGQRLTRRALIAGLREDGHAVSTDRASALLKRLTATTTTTPVDDTSQTSSGAQNASEAA